MHIDNRTSSNYVNPSSNTYTHAHQPTRQSLYTTATYGPTRVHTRAQSHPHTLTSVHFQVLRMGKVVRGSSRLTHLTVHEGGARVCVGVGPRRLDERRVVPHLPGRRAGG